MNVFTQRLLVVVVSGACTWVGSNGLALAGSPGLPQFVEILDEAGRVVVTIRAPRPEQGFVSIGSAGHVWMRVDADGASIRSAYGAAWCVLDAWAIAGSSLRSSAAVFRELETRLTGPDVGPQVPTVTASAGMSIDVDKIVAHERDTRSTIWSAGGSDAPR